MLDSVLPELQRCRLRPKLRRKRFSCESDIETEVTQQVEEGTPQKARWSRIKCDFPSVRAWDKTGEKPGMFAEI